MLLQSLVPALLTASKTAAAFATKNSNALLTGIALGTLMGTALSVASAVPKVMKVEETKKEDLEIARNDEERKHIKRAAAVKVAKILVVPVLMFLVCGGCIIGNAYINSKKIAALAAAYALSEQKIEDLENAAKEISGPKKAALISEKAGKDDIERRASRNEEDVITTGHGDDLFWEPKTGHWLRANRDFVLLAFSEIDKLVNNGLGDTIHLNELFERLKLPCETELGQWFGWDPNDEYGNVVGCNLVNTGKHFWDNGNSDYYTIIDYTVKFLGKTGHRV